MPRSKPCARESQLHHNHNQETFLLRPSISERPSIPYDELRESDLKIGPVEFEETLQLHSSRLARSRTELSQNDNVGPVEADNAQGAIDLHSAIRVIGAAEVGKSTFIKAVSNTEDGRLLSEAVPFAFSHCSCRVNFHEVALESLDEADFASASGSGAHSASQSDLAAGTVIIYDVMDSSSLYGVPELLKSLHLASEPVVLVAAKCDNPPASRDVQPREIAHKAMSIIKDIKTFESALFSSTAPLAAIQGLLSLIIAKSGLDVSHTTGRPSDFGSSSLAGMKDTTAPLAKSLSFLDLQAVEAPDSTPSTRSANSNNTLDINRSKAIPPDRKPELSSESGHRPAQRLPRPGFSPKPSSFLILDDLSSTEAEPDAKKDLSSAMHAASTQKYASATFEQLVDMLLRPVPDTDDVDFLYAFLAFYRLFASPLRLLESILEHYASVEENMVTPWEAETILDRDITVIDTWIKQYPGDFARPNTRNRLHDFLTSMAPERITRSDSTDASDKGYFSAPGANNTSRAAAAQQIWMALEDVMEDEDTDWACSDPTVVPSPKQGMFPGVKTVSAAVVTSSGRYLDLAQSARANHKYDNMLIFGGQSTLTLNAMGRTEDSSNSSTDLSIASASIAESAQRQAYLLVPTPRRPLEKDIWRLVIDLDDEAIAAEFTRIDWILFSAIRPRHLIRHATAPDSHSSKLVARVNNHFNHLAYWVTNMILLREKPKHRAEMLGKMMSVATKLRKLNNYNALGAFVATIRGPAISRLTATRELVDAYVQKKFASLELLMSTARGHWAYRFALENTEQSNHPRIPFLPLHRRDLIVAESAGKTFITEEPQTSAGQPLPTDPSASTTSLSTTRSLATIIPTTSTPISNEPKINWPKFAVMGETLAILRKAQFIPYTDLPPNETVKSLLLDLRLCKDDDRLYARSLAVEVSGSAAGVNDGQRAHVKRRLQDGLERLKQAGKDA